VFSAIVAVSVQLEEVYKDSLTVLFTLKTASPARSSPGAHSLTSPKNVSRLQIVFFLPYFAILLYKPNERRVRSSQTLLNFSKQQLRNVSDE